MTNKVWYMTNGFQKKLQNLEKYNKYSFAKFELDIVQYLNNESSIKFRKHIINVGNNKKIYSITLGYDLRALYFFVRKKSEGIIEYVFFDIGDHDHVY